jgi:cullin-associated NEDD8-dissociated protein 1
VSINALLKKTEHYDKDERYMATSDLCEVIKRFASHSSTGGGSSGNSSSYEGYGHKLDATTERRICAAVLSLLKDKSNDVQAVAVKTLGVLLTTVQEEQVLEIADSLTDQVLDLQKSELRDVYAIGLRTLCKTVPAPMGDHVSQRLVSRLLEGMAPSTSGNDEIILACLDILTDLLSRFGATAASLTRQHEPILQMCLSQLTATSHLIRKRAGNAIGCLSGVLSDTLLVRMVESLLSQIEMATSQKGDTRALIRTMCTVSGVVGHRLGQLQIDRILPIFLSFCQPNEALTGDDDDDNSGDGMGGMDEDNRDDAATSLQNEVRESCFNGFESFVLKSPKEVEPHLTKIVQAALAYMSYDPNYSYGDEEEEQVDDGDEDQYDDDDDEFEDDDDDDDEDDDDSWKVRRSAIRALTAVVESKRHNPSLLWNKVYNVRRGKSNTVAGALVSRFKEREENCRVDVIDCFTKLLSVTVAANVNGNVSFASDDTDDMMMDTTSTETTVIDFRAKYAEALVKACEKLLSGKKGGDRSKSSALSLLSTLCRVPGGLGAEAEIGSVLEHVKTLLSDGSSGADQQQQQHHTATVSKGLKLEALSLVRVMLSCNMHDPVHVKQGLHKLLLDDLCLAVKERWYKVIAEALRVLTEVPKFFVIGYSSQDEAAKKAETSAVATTLYEAMEPLLAASDVDQEIKECALTASAALLSALHNSLTPEQMGRMLSLLLEKLRNETTRIAAIKTLSTIASASNNDSSSMVDNNAIALTPILGEAISVLASYLKQQSRSLKQNSLEALDIVITNHGTEDPTLADGQLFSSVLSDLAGLIVDSDLHLSHLSMCVCISTLRVCSSSGPAAKEHALPPALALSTSSLLQEPALESLLKLLEQMIVSGAVDFAELFQMLKEKSSADSLGKHAVANLAKCIGVITAATTIENREGVVSDLLASVEGAGSDASDVRQVVLNLLVSGDLGRVVDYSTMDGVAERIQAIYLGAFDSPSEEIKHAASYALGRAAIGSQSVLLPSMVMTLENSNQKKQYLLLSAIREFIQCQLKTNREGLAACIPMILPNLLNHTSDTEEGSRTMVAECLGSLTCVAPTEMLKKLQELVTEHSAIAAEGGHITEGDDASKKNALVCWTAVSSVKHAIAGKASVTDLSRAMPVFLELLKQEEVSVRSAALLMVYSSVHHMPQVVASFMQESIMPALYDVSQLKLKRIVDLGPFKHTVDDALPMRKSAMSIFATCLEKLPGSMDIAAFMPILAQALGDLEDVQLQAHHIVITASLKHPTYVVAAMENFVPPLETMFMDKTFKKKTANKTGTELERAKEWIKSGLRALLVMSKLEGSLANRRFATLVERVKTDAKFRPMLDAIEEER